MPGSRRDGRLRGDGLYLSSHSFIVLYRRGPRSLSPPAVLSHSALCVRFPLLCCSFPLSSGPNRFDFFPTAALGQFLNPNSRCPHTYRKWQPSLLLLLLSSSIETTVPWDAMARKQPNKCLGENGGHSNQTEALKRHRSLNGGDKALCVSVKKSV